MFANQSLIAIPTSVNNSLEQENGEAQMVRKLTNTSRKIVISYATRTVKVITTSRLIDLPSFISSVGGNLGLFVGFSFINMFFFLYEEIEKRV